MFLDKNWEISEVLDDIILGRGVKRTVHSLEYDQSVITDLFISRLRLYKYHPLAVADIRVEVGYRIPAFFIQGKFAIFGYVFWEVFSENKKRKLWGSVVKNKKGDWKFVLSGNSDSIVFANLSNRQEVDLFHLL